MPWELPVVHLARVDFAQARAAGNGTAGSIAVVRGGGDIRINDFSQFGISGEPDEMDLFGCRCVLVLLGVD